MKVQTQKIPAGISRYLQDHDAQNCKLESWSKKHGRTGKCGQGEAAKACKACYVFLTGSKQVGAHAPLLPKLPHGMRLSLVERSAEKKGAPGGGGGGGCIRCSFKGDSRHPFSQQWPMWTNLFYCLGFCPDGQYESRDSLLVFVPSSHGTIAHHQRIVQSSYINETRDGGITRGMRVEGSMD